MNPRTCVAPSGRFIFGIHTPGFRVDNFRQSDNISALGPYSEGGTKDNTANFPQSDVDVDKADRVYEIPNAFPFKGTTYIAESWARAKAENPTAIRLPKRRETSLTQAVRKWSEHPIPDRMIDKVFQSHPDALMLALAMTSTDPEDLVRLAEMSCRFEKDPSTGQPVGMHYKKDERGRIVSDIENHALFEAVANNRHLPDSYKHAMVLKPGAQGVSEIVGEWAGERSHVFEYLRRNSYIPWGHYASNMADDAIRYRIGDLASEDISGLRHLYYQRTYARLARQSGVDIPARRRQMSVDELEELRIRISRAASNSGHPTFDCGLWGWNFGFDYAPTGYRMHGSHQQIHQQFAMIPAQVPTMADSTETFVPFACGDLIADFTREYRSQTGKPFFDTYLEAIRNNRRMDGGGQAESSLVVFEDDHVMLFVPKAQTSQWELQLMATGPVGNVLEADTETRASLDRAILAAVKTLSAMGAEMITTIEYSKRFGSGDTDQRLLYAFLPKLPESPGGFSEAQLRWINGHFPEDFAIACRSGLQSVRDQ